MRVLSLESNRLHSPVVHENKTFYTQIEVFVSG